MNNESMRNKLLDVYGKLSSFRMVSPDTDCNRETIVAMKATAELAKGVVHSLLSELRLSIVAPNSIAEAMLTANEILSFNMMHPDGTVHSVTAEDLRDEAEDHRTLDADGEANRDDEMGKWPVLSLPKIVRKNR